MKRRTVVLTIEIVRQPMSISLKTGFSIIAAVSLLGFNSSASQAKEIRHQGAHEHGVAHMNVALEGNHWYRTYQGPAADRHQKDGTCTESGKK
jgi:hypothetical protein